MPASMPTVRMEMEFVHVRALSAVRLRQQSWLPMSVEEEAEPPIYAYIWHMYIEQPHFLRKRRVDYCVPYVGVRRLLSLANEIGLSNIERDQYT